MKLIIEVYKYAAVIQAYANLCHERTPATDANNRQAHDAWKERNRWETLASLMTKSEQVRKMFEEARQAAFRSLSATAGFTSTCQVLPQMLATPQFDPSVRHNAELNRIADQLHSKQAVPASPSATSSEPTLPMAAPVTPSRPVTAGNPKGSNQVEGIITHQETLMGLVGITTNFIPHILFKDGMIHKDLSVSPYDLDVKKSRELEPKKWGRWQKVGKDIKVQWNNGESETWGHDEWYNTKW